METRRLTSRRLLTVLVAPVLVAVAALAYRAYVMQARTPFLSTASNLKRCAMAFALYAPDDYYPPLLAEQGVLMVDPMLLHPRHLPDLALLLHPGDPAIGTTTVTPQTVLDRPGYIYLGYHVWNDDTVEAFADAYRNRIREGRAFDSDLPVDTPVERLVRLDNKLRRFGFISETESQHPKWEFTRQPDSTIPVLIELPKKSPGKLERRVGIPIPLFDSVIGGHVLYKDGHVEFIPYPGKWPMTERTIAILKSLQK